MTDIRALEAGDRTQWDALWRGYLRFYRQRLSPEITQHAFARLLDETTPLHGLVAVDGNHLVGLAHFLFHPSTWSLTHYCYLEDLYVDPAARGRGIARALIHAVYDAADRAGATAVYWNTQEFNADARALYDTLAHRTSFIRYER